MTATARRDELLAATRRVVGRVGFASTTVGEITREAGASLGLLHYHFDSKAEVVAETFAQIAREDLAELEAAADAHSDPAARLAATLEQSGWADRDSWRLWIDAWGEAVHSEPMRATLAGFQAGWRALLTRVLADGARAGAWECADPEDTAGRLVAVIDGIGLHAALHPDTVPAELAGAWVRRVAEAELSVALPARLPAPAPARAAAASTVERTVTLRHGDRDAAGRLGAAACATLLASARDAWLDGRGEGATLSRLVVSPLALAAPGETVTAACMLAHAGHATLRTRETLHAQDGTLLATAEATLALRRPLSDAQREELR